MKYRRKLFASRDPYDCTKSKLFLAACKENLDYLIANCEDYRKICARFGIRSSKDIKKPEDIPVIPTMLMKQHDFRSGRYLVMATSSGTSGSMSHIRFELGALLAALKMSIKVTRYHGVMSSRPCRYIVMGYKPHRSNKTAVAKTAYLTTYLAPAISRKYILKHTKDGYKPDFDSIVKALKKYEKGDAPVRFMGFPSYTFFLFRLLEERGLSFKLPADSKIMLGGGWKQFYQEAVDKETFYKLAKKTLNIDEKNIVEFFGAVEHPILYTDCEYHHFHVPVYSKVVIRDPETLEPLKYGQTGLVNLITPICKATPILSIMTDDLGILHDGKNCPCGVKSPYLEIVGRVAPQDIKTCAAGAAEILQGVKI
ncbi:MAG: acyl-protein synthetase [Lachnospiraceae bacterium]|nr:acyl-protein synthetase [Lachnospiraceae bacterium]MBR5658949.1 acyl-protein synthetase [Lachnospiraceae bacterium]